MFSRWKDMSDMASRLLTLCNSYTPHEMREVCVATLKEMLMLWPQEMIAILLPHLHRAHTAAAEAYGGAGGGGDAIITNLGPYFPRKNGPSPSSLNLKAVRPPRPMLQMNVPPTAHLDLHHGQDTEYDRQLHR